MTLASDRLITGRSAFAFDGHTNFSTTSGTPTTILETGDLALSGTYYLHARVWIETANPGSLVLEVSTNGGSSWVEITGDPHARTDTRGAEGDGWNAERHIHAVYEAIKTVRFRVHVSSEGTTVANSATADNRFETRLHILPIGK